MFTVLEDAYAILMQKGVYKQVKVYERKGKIYAAHSTGYLLLNYKGSTSIPDVRWDDLYLNFIYKRNEFGHIVDPQIYDGKAIPV